MAACINAHLPTTAGRAGQTPGRRAKDQGLAGSWSCVIGAAGGSEQHKEPAAKAARVE
jgi:hypothetical protein